MLTTSVFARSSVDYQVKLSHERTLSFEKKTFLALLVELKMKRHPLKEDVLEGESTGDDGSCWLIG